MSDLQISTITFTDQGVVVQYIDLATDVRGPILHQHQLTLSGAHRDYADDIDALHHKAQRMVSNALEDFENTEPTNPKEMEREGDDEDEMGGRHA